MDTGGCSVLPSRKLWGGEGEWPTVDEVLPVLELVPPRDVHSDWDIPDCRPTTDVVDGNPSFRKEFLLDSWSVDGVTTPVSVPDSLRKYPRPWCHSDVSSQSCSLFCSTITSRTGSASPSYLYETKETKGGRIQTSHQRGPVWTVFG